MNSPTAPDRTPDLDFNSALAEAISHFARRPRVLVALDFDGTLAPEVDDPAEARALPVARAALLALAALPETTVALVSGRALSSLAAVAQVPESVALIGSHGLELHRGPGDHVVVDDHERERVRALRTALTPRIETTSGAWIEDKPAGFAVHTRLSALADVAELQADLSAAARLLDPRLTERIGKNVIEFAVRDATKADGLAVLRQHCTPNAVLFAGDDLTDEDAFAVLGPDDVGIKVGPGPSAAEYGVRDAHELAAVLEHLVRARQSDIARRPGADQSGRAPSGS